MLLYLITVLFLVYFCKGQQILSCSVPTVCTRDDGSTFTTWRPMDDSPRPPIQPQVVSTTSTTTTVGSSDGDTETVQRLAHRIALLSEPGWYYRGNNYQYWFSNNGVAVSRLNAITICNSMNSQLPVEGIRNQNSREFIVENILKRCADVHGWWIGLTDVGEEGSFVWDDGLALEESGANWNQGQPDNNNNADCGVIARYFNYNWDDVPCNRSTTNFGILCERYLGTP